MTSISDHNPLDTYNLRVELTLTEPFGKHTMKRAVLLVAASMSMSLPVLADQALATAKNCMACHAVEKKLVGPSYKDIAVRYAGQKDAVDKLANKIIKGGSGVWGPVPMPANAQVNDAEAKRLAAWVLATK